MESYKYCDTRGGLNSRKIKIALVNLEGVEGFRGDINDDDRFSHENLSLGYLAANLRVYGFTVHILDALSFEMTNDEILGKLIDLSPQLVGYTTYFSNIVQTLEHTELLKTKSPYIYVVLGGHQINFVEQQILEENPQIDFIIRGEGELPLTQLAERICKGENFGGIDGLWYRAGDEIIQNNGLAVVEDVNAIPNPARDVLEFRRGRNCYPTAVIVTTRRCGMQCSFCVNPLLFGKHHITFRDANRVVDEMEDLKSRYQSKLFLFSDCLFAFPSECGLEHARAIGHEIVRRGLRINFRFYCRVDSFKNNEELFALLKEAGLEGVFVGIESGSQEELNRYEKGVRISDSINFLEMAEKYNVAVFPGFLMFNPYSTYDSLKANARFLWAHKLGHIFRNFSTTIRLYPGIRMIDDLRRDGLLHKDYDYKNVFAYDYQIPEIGELADALQEVRREVKSIDRLSHEMNYKFAKAKDFVKQTSSSYIAGVVQEAERLRKQMSNKNYHFFLGCVDIAQDSWNADTFAQLCADYLKEFSEDYSALIELDKATGEAIDYDFHKFRGSFYRHE